MIKVKGHWTLNIDNAQFITGGTSSVIEITPVIFTLNEGPWGKVCHVFMFARSCQLEVNTKAPDSVICLGGVSAILLQRKGIFHFHFNLTL